MLVAEKLVSGGRLPIKDQSSDRKVRDAQEGYLRLLGRWSLLCKNLLCAFIFSSLEKYKGCGIFNGGSKKGAGSRRGGVPAARQEGGGKPAASLHGVAGVLLAPSQSS